MKLNRTSDSRLTKESKNSFREISYGSFEHPFPSTSLLLHPLLSWNVFLGIIMISWWKETSYIAQVHLIMAPIDPLDHGAHSSNFFILFFPTGCMVYCFISICCARDSINSWNNFTWSWRRYPVLFDSKLFRSQRCECECIIYTKTCNLPILTGMGWCCHSSIFLSWSGFRCSTCFCKLQ